MVQQNGHVRERRLEPYVVGDDPVDRVAHHAQPPMSGVEQSAACDNHIPTRRVSDADDGGAPGRGRLHGHAGGGNPCRRGGHGRRLPSVTRAPVPRPVQAAAQVVGQRGRTGDDGDPVRAEPFHHLVQVGAHVRVAGVDLVEDDDLARDRHMAHGGLSGAGADREQLVDGAHAAGREQPHVRPVEPSGQVFGLDGPRMADAHGLAADPSAHARQHRVRGGARGQGVVDAAHAKAGGERLRGEHGGLRLALAHRRL